jgi:O-acetyl-ADP-ribose deacetylase (regulator of RNase III)
MFPTELLEVENQSVAVEYIKCNTEFYSGEGIVYTEFMGEIATRQVSFLDGEYYPSASLKDRNDKIGFLLYDGKKCDLDLSQSEVISRDFFEEIWIKSLLKHEEKTKIIYITGDAATPLKESIIISHVVNNQGKWGKGFVLSLSKKFPKVKNYYVNKFSSEGLKLGDVQFFCVNQNDRVFIANMISQDGVKKNKYDKNQYISYESLEESLNSLANFCLINRLSVQMPKIGAGLGGGDWDYISNLIEKYICKKMIECYVVSL